MPQVINNKSIVTYKYCRGSDGKNRLYAGDSMAIKASDHDFARYILEAVLMRHKGLKQPVVDCGQEEQFVKFVFDQCIVDVPLYFDDRLVLHFLELAER